MNLKKIIFLMLIIAAGCQVYAQNSFSLKSVKASVKGSSSLHDWESDITKFDFSGSLTIEKGIRTVRSIDVKIPVKGIKSREGKIMDHKTFEAFKSDANPTIQFKCAAAAVRIDSVQGIIIEAPGDLSMAGATRHVTLFGKGKLLPNGDWSLTVSKTFKMTEFKMEPPTAVLGTIKVGDEVTVIFNLILSPAKKTI